jgi:DNA-directed RNA polymerase subunit K/omega
MIFRPDDRSGFLFVKVASLRAAQLMRGCTPRVVAGLRPTVTAQREVAEGKVVEVPRLNNGS